MTEKNKEQRIAEILSMFAEIYDKQLSAPAARAYLEILSAYPLEKIEKASTSLLKEHSLNRFPLPADFVKHLEPPAELDDRANMAWLLATNKMQSEGRWNTVHFDDPIIHHTIARLGGWVEWGDRLYVASQEDLVWIQKDFERVYKNCLQLIDKEEPAPLLVGNCDLQNLQSGYIKQLGESPQRITGTESLGDIVKRVTPK